MCVLCMHRHTQMHVHTHMLKTQVNIRTDVFLLEKN